MTLALRAPPSGPAVARDHGRVFGLDLVRMSAILLVLICHSGMIWSDWLGFRLPKVIAKTGTFGVELFFVLSGFLIGGILIRTLDGGAFTARRLGIFMVRRWMRTIPLYWLWILVLMVLVPPEPGCAWRDLWRYGLFTQNLLPPQLDWFFPVSWTLACEEWFYATFALALFLLRKRLSPDRALGAAIALFVASGPILRAAIYARGDLDQYRIVAFWLDCIAYGVLAAWIAARRPALFARGRRLLPLFGLLVILLWCDETVHVTPVRLHAIASFGVIAAALTLCLPAASAWTTTRSWARRPVEWLSERSYGIYIVHLSLLHAIAQARSVHHWPAIPCIAASVALFAILPDLSWRFFERPILRLRPREQGPREKAGPARDPAFSTSEQEAQAAFAIPRST